MYDLQVMLLKQSLVVILNACTFSDSHLPSLQGLPLGCILIHPLLSIFTHISLYPIPQDILFLPGIMLQFLIRVFTSTLVPLQFILYPIARKISSFWLYFLDMFQVYTKIEREVPEVSQVLSVSTHAQPPISTSPTRMVLFLSQG